MATIGACSLVQGSQILEVLLLGALQGAEELINISLLVRCHGRMKCYGKHRDTMNSARAKEHKESKSKKKQ